MSLNQWITVAIAPKIGVVETTADFLARRAGTATPAALLPFLDGARHEPPPARDESQAP